MSVPYYEVTCDRCGYAETSLVTVGSFLWRRDSEEGRIDRRLALCADCGGLAPMEVLPDRKLLEAALALRRGRDAHAALPRFRRVFTSPPSPGGEDVESLSQEPGLETMLAVLDLGRPPACLFCCGVSIEPLVLDIGGGSEAPVPPTLLGRAHPGCGGALSARWSGRSDRIAPAETTRVYDIYGRLVSREPGWRRPKHR